MTDPAPELDAVLGVRLPADLAAQALTHRSYAYEHGGLPHNERLEFLGDAVLELIVTEHLYAAYPDRPEGDLAKIRASLVNTYVLADIARELGPTGLGALLRLGRGEELTGGRDKHSILADTLEAVFGAVYLTHGLDVARGIVEGIIGERLRVVPTLGAALDWKTSLQEKCSALGRPKARYEITSTGPDHDKTFTAVALVGDDPLGQGVGRTKKEAEQKAAEQAWAALDRATG
ncbi:MULTISPECIES: ribonuclease III [unclassified Dietzia]|uniref:ribonuclease III n=1 Tax=unclassified Dietzia TaxID=2617939 RepID=UPI001317DF64|nr:MULTISPECIES: ribonuclease III [unclassified Dietzia]QGW24938.1 ribonuclease III [Dietzia sp. DQ12-45-1b]